ncbi:apicoplast ribosomal protein S14p/S29e precursor, putative [Plasmodium gallinaceum]|uniref:Apicoplast ribosomal protein S14p/S29e, putative n=1 Tax=Plasmodium gallinaceum TaxID=5849 RepID=A0A1J1GZH8_PLAGA|nr:apicoplast ribosomal protein S14p/S29e precursor, putative [Plasmodium gallinaceum]CRG96427.1 apicoplast ribosomal protein S14p/S29e precursor, putative [Plasmodium gallinaceum]
MLNFIKYFLAYLILVDTQFFCINHQYSFQFFINNYKIYKNGRSKNYLKRIIHLNLKKRLDPSNKYTVIKRHEAKIQRNLKRKYLIERYKEKRDLLKKYISEASSPIEYVYWKYKLSRLPRDSCPVRYRNRCAITGRARGYYKFFGLCRHQARALIQKMFFPGFVKASW